MSAWNEAKGTTDHAALQREVAKLRPEFLEYVINDCKLAMDANPSNRKNGHYADCIHYCAMQLAKLANS